MGKAFGLIVMLLALYIGMTIYSRGLEQAYGGLFAPIASSDRDSSPATALTPLAGTAEAPTEAARRVKITDAVRDRVTADIAAGARRYSP